MINKHQIANVGDFAEPSGGEVQTAAQRALANSFEDRNGGDGSDGIFQGDTSAVDNRDPVVACSSRFLAAADFGMLGVNLIFRIIPVAMAKRLPRG